MPSIIDTIEDTAEDSVKPLMDFIASTLLLTCVVTACAFLLFPNSSHRRSANRLPPGPFSYPIIGNILQLGKSPHVSLAKLAKKYGPLMRLKLGQVNTIVVSSPEIAKEILQTNDQSFPGRKSICAAQAFDHHQISVACLPVGSQWRNLRKICKEQMFSTQRLEASRGLRRVKFQKLIEYLEECTVCERVIDIGEVAFVTSLNLISNTLFSTDFAEYDTGSSHELKGIVHGLMKVMGSPNLADYFPVLVLVDPQGIKREAEAYFGKLLDLFDGIIDQRLKTGKDSPRKNDLLEALLENMSQGNQSELTRDDIKHLLLDLFVAGTDTTSGTVEWVMTELLRNPCIMCKAKDELRAIVGEDKQIEESDISKLPYLQAVIKETFRYHPPGPFLLRNTDNNELEISCFAIPKNSVILINIWAIGRDPRIWSNPEQFEPERFLNSDIDAKGQNFELIPFGAGRRICPGLPLAYRMVHLLVASLIKNFDWKLEPGITPEKIDISEKFGLSLQKAMPLKALPVRL